jgi:hypothetical protein
MKLSKILAACAVAYVMVGCSVDADDDDATVVPGGSDTTVIDKADTPDVTVNPPSGGTVTTTGQ